MATIALSAYWDAGGFAEVYLGEHIRLNTQAAIKVRYEQFGQDDAEQFLKEAQTIANLVHPHIVRIFDFDVSNGMPFLVMDYAPNGTLRQRYPKNTRVSSRNHHFPHQADYGRPAIRAR